MVNTFVIKGNINGIIPFSLSTTKLDITYSIDPSITNIIPAKNIHTPKCFIKIYMACDIIVYPHALDA